LPPEEETPQAEEQTPQGEGDSTTDLSQSQDSELSAEVQKLSPAEQTHLANMLKKLTAGEASWDDLKRVPKLKNQIEQLKQEFQSQIEALKSERAAEAQTLQTLPAQVPETVAKLKTAEEIEARLELAHSNAEALQDYLDANPGDAETRYQVGDQEFTRKQLIEKRAAWRGELRALPRRLSEINARAQFQQARHKAEADIRRDFPILNDEENPDTKMALKLAKDPRFAGDVAGDYMALALATGHRMLQAELTARKAKGNGGSRPAGKVPLGKPGMTGAGGAPARTSSPPNASELLKRVGTDRNKESFVALIEATGR
jgi:hypothetical protein